MSPEPTRSAFRILVVCTANQIRSPLVELTLRRRAADLGLPVEVGSAGTAAKDGLGLPADVLQELDRRDIDATGWRSRALTHDLLAHADLVLTADSTHRASVVRSAPGTMSRVFLLLQAARIAREMPAIALLGQDVVGQDVVGQNAAGSAAQAPSPREGDGPRLAAAYLAGLTAWRSRIQPPAQAGGDDIADPVGRGRRSLRRTARAVDQAVDDLLQPFVGR